MTRRYWPLILTLASLWGASYFLIKVGVDGGFSPAALMASRALLAAVVLLGYLATTIGLASALGEIRAAWRACLVLGTINAAVPFWLVAWGEMRIDSGIAAIAQATVPLFSLLVGLRFLPQRAREQAQDRRRRARDRRRRPHRRDCARWRPRRGGRHARGDPCVPLLRLGGHLRAAPTPRKDVWPRSSRRGT